MELDKSEIAAFQQLWLEAFGQSITDERALKEARRLLALISFAIQEVPRSTVSSPENDNEIPKNN